MFSFFSCGHPDARVILTTATKVTRPMHRRTLLTFALATTLVIGVPGAATAQTGGLDESQAGAPTAGGEAAGVPGSTGNHGDGGGGSSSPSQSGDSGSGGSSAGSTGSTPTTPPADPNSTPVTSDGGSAGSGGGANTATSPASNGPSGAGPA